MDHLKLQPPNRYYSVLGLSTDASPCAIRSAYKKLAMKWHPDKCIVSDRAEAKQKFQEIQEAYAVLSDERKKMLYDNGLYDPEDDDEDIEGLSNFMKEMSSMMANVQEAGKVSSFEELQQLFVNTFSADIDALNNPPVPSISFDKKRRSWGRCSNDPTSSYIGSYINESFSTSQTHAHYFFTDTFHYGSSANMNSRKKNKCGKVAPNCVNSNICTSGFINKGNGLHTTTGNGFCSTTTHDNGSHTTTGNGFGMTTHDNGFSNNGR